jgi:hypothetical protein
MTYRDSTDPPRTAHPSLLFFGALVVAATIVAIISLIYALNRGPIEQKTGIGPSPTQSAPRSA